MKTYEQILDGLLRSLEKEGLGGPQEIGERYLAQTAEAMYREGILQIISERPRVFRIKFLLRHPTLALPYMFRIRTRK